MCIRDSQSSALKLGRLRADVPDLFGNVIHALLNRRILDSLIVAHGLTLGIPAQFLQNVGDLMVDRFRLLRNAVRSSVALERGLHITDLFLQLFGRSNRGLDCRLQSTGAHAYVVENPVCLLYTSPS